jgi:Peptidase A4 family
MYVNARSRRLGRFVGLSALVAIALAFVILFGVVSNESTSAASFGPMAGYVWQGHVRSLQGSWTVPRILNRSHGSASTWIGVQAPGTPKPFIQIGSDEAEGFRPGDAPEAHYNAFWSDVARGSRPHTLFRVNPGDDLSASLTLAENKWRLAIVDTSSGAAARFSANAETGAPLEQAEWTQEDVADGAAKPLPYPQLGAVSFRRLAVNSAIPSSARLSAEWMSVGGKSIAPSPLQDGSFRLQPAPALTAAGKQYLRIIGPEEAAAYAFYGQLARWTARTPYPQIASASSNFGAALAASVQALAHARWPASAQAPLRALIGDMRVPLEHLRPAPSLPAASLAGWRAARTREAEADAVGDAEDALRRALNVPLVPVR